MVWIAEEGFLNRSKLGVTGWTCTNCWHFSTYLEQGTMCPSCKRADTVYENKSLEKTKEQTQMQLDRQRFQPLQPDKYDPFSRKSQLGNPLTAHQVVELLKRMNPRVVGIPSWGMGTGRDMMGLYVKKDIPPTEIVTEFQQKEQLKYVCACELGMMPEWDIILRDARQLPTGLIRGWRSVFGIFYRAHLIPFIPADNERLSNYQIKLSPLKETPYGR